MPYSNRDQDKSKGATEDDGRINTVPGNTSMPGQLGHRDPDPIIKSSDTDFLSPARTPNTAVNQRLKTRISSKNTPRKIFNPKLQGWTIGLANARERNLDSR